MSLLEKKVEFKMCEGEDTITVFKYANSKDFKLRTSFLDGYTYLSRQEMLNFIDGLKEIVGNE